MSHGNQRVALKRFEAPDFKDNAKYPSNTACSEEWAWELCRRNSKYQMWVALAEVGLNKRAEWVSTSLFDHFGVNYPGPPGYSYGKVSVETRTLRDIGLRNV